MKLKPQCDTPTEPLGWGKSERQVMSSAGEGCENEHLGKVWAASLTLHVSDTGAPLLGTSLTEARTNIHPRDYGGMFAATLFITAKNDESHQRPSIVQQMDFFLMVTQ